MFAPSDALGNKKRGNFNSPIFCEIISSFTEKYFFFEKLWGYTFMGVANQKIVIFYYPLFIPKLWVLSMKLSFAVPVFIMCDDLFS